MDAERRRRVVSADPTPASAADIPSVDRLLNALWLDLRRLEAADEAEFAVQWNSFDR